MPSDALFRILIAWLITYAVVVSFALFWRSRSGRSENEIFTRAGLGLGGLFELTKVLWSLLNARQELMDSIDFDGIIVLTIGCAAGIAASIHEIFSLFKRPKRR